MWSDNAQRYSVHYRNVEGHPNTSKTKHKPSERLRVVVSKVKAVLITISSIILPKG
jgi:hypothetical protein